MDDEAKRPAGSGAEAQQNLEHGVSWLLPGTGQGRSARWWTVLILGTLLASRFLLFPDGPWEQDEAIFSTGVISFDVPSHQPHPPGFPGWMLLGKLLFPLTKDALVALRVWSSLSSVAAVWLLSRLVAPFSGPRAALAGCLAFALSPLIWAHSPRAFSSFPSLALGLVTLYAWVQCRSLTAPRALVGWAILGFAVTIRPQLAPELAMVGLVGLWRLRSRLGLVLLGIGLSLLVVVAVFGVAIADSGFDAYWTSTLQHLGNHFSGSGGPRLAARSLLDRVGDWGFVRTSGGLIGATLLMLSCAFGLVCIFKQDRKTAVWWLLLIVVTTGMLMYAHAPSIPRYQISLLLVLAGPVTVAFARLGRAGVVGLGALSVVGSVFAYPALRAMHGMPFPPVAALRAIAANNPHTILYSGGFFSFAKYLEFAGQLPTHPTGPDGAKVAMPRDTYVLGGHDMRFLAGPHTCVWKFHDFPEAAWELSQKRFDRVFVAKNPVLLGSGIFNLESIGKGRRAAWLSEEGTVNVPAPSELLMLRLDVPKDYSPQRLSVVAGENVLLQQTLEGGKQTVAVPLVACNERCIVTLRLPDSWNAANDPRTLTARLLEAWAIKGGETGSWRWHPEQPDPPPGVEFGGFYPPEQGGVSGQGRWTMARAVVSFEATRGTVLLGVRRPTYTPGIVRIATKETELLPDVRNELTRLAFRVSGGPQKRVAVSLESPTFTPAKVEASTDTRALGLQVTELAYYPDVESPCEGSALGETDTEGPLPTDAP